MTRSVIDMENPPPVDLPEHQQVAAAVRDPLAEHPLLEPLRDSGAPDSYGPRIGCHDQAIWIRFGPWRRGEDLEVVIEGERWWQAPPGVRDNQAEYLAARLAAELREPYSLVRTRALAAR